MVLNGTAFQELSLSNEKRTSGLWTHRGRLTVKDQVGTAIDVGGGVYTSMRSLLLTPTSPGTGWVDAPLRIDGVAGSSPRIGFHESGVYAMSLFKKPGTSDLFITGQGGPTDTQRLNARLLGSYNAPNTYAVPQGGAWYETSVQVNFTSTGVPLTSFHFQCPVQSPSAISTIYIGLGLDGALTWPSVVMATVNTGWTVPMSGTIFATNQGAGAHRVSLWMYAGTAGCSFIGNASLFVVEP